MAVCLIQQGPYRLDDIRAVGVHQEVGRFLIMPGRMHIHHALRGHGADEGARIELVVDAVDIDIVDVQMQQAIGFFQNGIDEAGLVHFRDVCHHIKRGVFNGDLAFQDVLGAADARRHVSHRLTGKRDGQQVI